MREAASKRREEEYQTEAQGEVEVEVASDWTAAKRRGERTAPKRRGERTASKRRGEMELAATREQETQADYQGGEVEEASAGAASQRR